MKSGEPGAGESGPDHWEPGVGDSVGSQRVRTKSPGSWEKLGSQGGTEEVGAPGVPGGKLGTWGESGWPGVGPRIQEAWSPGQDARGRSPLRSSRSHTVTMGRECLRWWMSHRDRVCTLCCELLNSDSFFSSAASEKADIPPKPRSRRPTPWSRAESRGGECRRPRRRLAPTPHPSPRPHHRHPQVRGRSQPSKMAPGRQ